MKRTLGLCALVCSLLPVGQASAAPQQTRYLHARLVPFETAAAASGKFTATAVVKPRSVLMRWQLSLAKLSGTAKRTSFQIGGTPGVGFTLCAPCSTNAHGTLLFSPSAWREIVAQGARIVVKTHAHPNGELHGTVKI